MVAPALNSKVRFWVSDPDPAIDRAEDVAKESVDRLEEEGVEAHGETGESDPLLALQDALATFEAQDIVLVTHPGGELNWQEDGVVDQVREKLPRPQRQAPGDSNGTERHRHGRRPCDHGGGDQELQPGREPQRAPVALALGQERGRACPSGRASPRHASAWGASSPTLHAIRASVSSSAGSSPDSAWPTAATRNVYARSSSGSTSTAVPIAGPASSGSSRSSSRSVWPPNASRIWSSLSPACSAQRRLFSAAKAGGL